jgi:hypothetical protein
LAALPVGAAAGQSEERVTIVDPLPVSILERIYSEKDELQGVTSQQLMRFQSHDQEIDSDFSIRGSHI